MITSHFEQNLQWIEKSAPALYKVVETCQSKNHTYKPSNSENDYDLYFGDERVIESCNLSLAYSLNQQLKQTDGVSMPRASRNNQSDPQSPENILASMVGVHSEVFFENLPSIITTEVGTLANRSKPIYKNLFIFGSLMFLPLLSYLQTLPVSPWISITLFEDNIDQLAATLSVVRLSELIDVCKKHNIKLSLHIDPDKNNLQDRLRAQIGYSDLTILYGIQILRSPIVSPSLMEVHSWLHSPEGASQYVFGVLGFATDEINQSQQALWNALAHENMSVIDSDAFDPSSSCVLVASGPSLAESLDWLKTNQNSLNIIAAGSSLGALLKSGIRPVGCVFLERGSEVYSELCDLLVQGYNLDGISVFVSSTIDPRVPALFTKSVFFHRPCAAASSIFPCDEASHLSIGGPHVINSALETMVCMGINKILLIGADFSASSRDNPRAIGALGESQRKLSIPVRGNQSRTVFSEPQLLYTSYLLDRFISSRDLLQVKRIGEGVILKSVEDVHLSSELVDEFKVEKSSFDHILHQLPVSSFNHQDCLDFFNELDADVCLWHDNIKSIVDSSACWNRDLADRLTPFLQRSTDTDTRARSMVSKLLCQPLFFSVMSLHDAADTDHFSTSAYSFNHSIQVMRDVVLKWTTVMRALVNAPQLPLWDPDWLRSHYKKSS